MHPAITEEETAAVAPAARWRAGIKDTFARPITLILCLTAPLLLAVWCLLSPPVIFSREMTWDLLYNLEGAWDLYRGQILHVDVHDPLGILPFLLTELGFRIAGVGTQAFLIGMLIYGGLIFVMAAFVIAPRLPRPAAILAVLYLVLLLLVPINLGDDSSTYTFAMSYNRFGWSGLDVLLFLLVFPRQRESAYQALDPLIGLALLAALFYLKITYFFVGVGVVAVALFLSPHLRTERRPWIAVLLAIAALAAAPFNLPYWSDIWASVMSGAVRYDPLGIARSALSYQAETTLLVAQFLCLAWLWRQRSIANRQLIWALLIIVAGIFVLSQNAQTGGVPLYVVISFMLFAALAKARLELGSRQGAGVALLLLASLIPPIFGVVSMSASLAGYWAKAKGTNDQIQIGETNLRGLAVPMPSADLIETFAQGKATPKTLIVARERHPRWDLAQGEYFEILQDAIALFRADAEGRRFGKDPRIMLFDSVNPLPFALGLTPPRGSSLWLDPAFPWRPAAEALADVDVVLVPKFSGRTTKLALTHYGDYLRDHFTTDGETMSWIIYRRAQDGERAVSQRN